MSNETTLWLIAAITGLAGLGIATLALLSGWRDWLALRRLEIEGRREPGSPGTGARIELAALRDRIRKLEAIAAGVDL